MSEIAYTIISVLCFVPAIVLHEVAHGYAAAKLGDPTAKNRGRLSLNPLKHIDPFGTVIMPLMLMAMGGPVFGFAKPVPYNPSYFKNVRKGEAIVGLAGPAANLAMAVVAAVALRALLPALSTGFLASQGGYILTFLIMFVMINLYLMFFNLLPVPPLDGSSVIALFLNDKQMVAYYRVQQYAMPILILLVLLVPSIFGFSPIGAYLDATAGTLAGLLLPY